MHILKSMRNHGRYYCVVSILLLIVVSLFVLFIFFPSIVCSRDIKYMLMRSRNNHKLQSIEKKLMMNNYGDQRRRKRSDEDEDDVARRIVRAIGSSPPRCAAKCGKCKPCKPVHVPVPPGTPVTAEYYPEAWRCKCGNRFYTPID